MENTIEPVKTQVSNANYDSAWKEIIEEHLEEFLAFFFPRVYRSIDFRIPPDFKSQEFREIVPVSEAGKRIADEVVRVRLKLKNGHTGCINIYLHLEVQGNRETQLEKRVFTYFYRLVDCTLKDDPETEVISLVVLTDEEENYRPDHFGYKRCGFEIYMKFPVIKIIDFKSNPKLIALLESSTNMMAMVVRAQLKSYEITRDDEQKKYDIKRELIYQCYRGGFKKESIGSLIKFLDYIFRLPRALEKNLKLEIRKIEEEYKMPYITSWEEMAKEEGVKIGEENGIKNTKLEMAKQMLMDNLPMATIMKYTGYALNDLAELSRSLSLSTQ